MDYAKLLSVPQGKVDVILDTDAYNEIDDQFAIAYMLRSEERLTVRAITAAPFFNLRSTGPKDGMERSYDEIIKLLGLAGCEDVIPKVYRGAERFLPSEREAVISPASEAICNIAREYTPENPLYVVAIGAITNVASAILAEPDIINRIVCVWLGGNALHASDNSEFNLNGDIAAARIVMGCGVPFVQLPCRGVVDRFYATAPELRYWLSGKNSLADYLCENTIAEADSYALGRPWSRVIWDVTAVAWLLNDGGRFMDSRVIPTPIPEYDRTLTLDDTRHPMRYVSYINRDELMWDLISKLTK